MSGQQLRGTDLREGSSVVLGNATMISWFHYPKTHIRIPQVPSPDPEWVGVWKETR